VVPGSEPSRPAPSALKGRPTRRALPLGPRHRGARPADRHELGPITVLRRRTVRQC
jgi:hypothetical protein